APGQAAGRLRDRLRVRRGRPRGNCSGRWLRIPPPDADRRRRLPGHRSVVETPRSAARLGGVHLPIAQDPPLGLPVLPDGGPGRESAAVGRAVLPRPAGGASPLLPALVRDEPGAGAAQGLETAAANHDVYQYERGPLLRLLPLAARHPEKRLA